MQATPPILLLMVIPAVSVRMIEKAETNEALLYTIFPTHCRLINIFFYSNQIKIIFSLKIKPNMKIKRDSKNSVKTVYNKCKKKVKI